MESLFTALEIAADGAYVIDAEQRIVYWNPAAQKMLGYTAEEVLDSACYEIVRGRGDEGEVWCQADCVVNTMARAGDSISSFNTCARTKSGALRWINVSILVVPEDGGNAGSRCVVHLFRDATEIKQQQQFANQILGAVRQLRQQSDPTAPPASGPAGASHLTRRELEVLSLLARGSSTRQIAEDLSISSSTTRNHIQNIFQKLQVHSRAEAVAYAFEHGLVNTD